MFKLYRNAQEAQLNWIRSHPFQYVALNAIALTVFIGYVQYKDRKEFSELNTEIDPQQQ